MFENLIICNQPQIIIYSLSFEECLKYLKIFVYLLSCWPLSVQNRVLLATRIIETVRDAEVSEKLVFALLQTQLRVTENQEKGVIGHWALPFEQFEALLLSQRANDSFLRSWSLGRKWANGKPSDDSTVFKFDDYAEVVPLINVFVKVRRVEWVASIDDPSKE